MTTSEIAEYLRIKERKVYDLVAQRRIPCTRAAGKWLFPKQLIDQWLIKHAEGLPEFMPVSEPPATISGSHDPLLEWAVRESDCGLALLMNGSLDGIERFANQQAIACAMHVLDHDSGDHNIPIIERQFADKPVVAIEWAWREQGLIVAQGNPLKINNLKDVTDQRFALRNKQAGSFLLLDYLLKQENLTLDSLKQTSPPLRSETEVALNVLSGDAVAGLGIAAAAYQMGLDFIPLIRERCDILIWRRSYFSPSFQKLLAFTRTELFQDRVEEMGGYDVSNIGAVRYNSGV